MKCPVCKKDFKNKFGVSSHLFKTKDDRHIGFVDKQKSLIVNAFYEDISCETLADQNDCWGSTTFICSEWSKISGYKERKSRMNSLSLKRQHKDGSKKMSKNFHGGSRKYKTDQGHTISKETYNNIISLFHTNLTFEQIAKRVSCDKKTIRPTFIREFGIEEYNQRVNRIRSISYKKSGFSNSLENKDPKKFNLIIDKFQSDDGIRTISNELNVGTGVIKNAWLKKFGKKAYEKRVAKMLNIQRARAANSLKKAKFAGSKNEILCYSMLAEILPHNVKHHDYSIVPRLEIDISIPDIKLAICWDGIGHRKPVFGREPFIRVKRNDAIRENFLEQNGWRHISVIDDGSYNPQLVENKVNKIVSLIKDSWVGKVEI